MVVPSEVGRVVFSKAGRDEGGTSWSWPSLTRDHVAIANGCQRKVDNPKRRRSSIWLPNPKFLKKFVKKFFAKRGFLTLKCRNKLDAIGYQEALLPRKEVKTLPKSDNIEVEGVVVEGAAGTANFRVELAGGHKIMAQISGKIRMNFIRIYPGDKVKVEISPL